MAAHALNQAKRIPQGSCRTRRQHPVLIVFPLSEEAIMQPRIDRAGSATPNSAARTSAASAPEHPKRWRIVQLHIHDRRGRPPESEQDWMQNLIDGLFSADKVKLKNIELDMYDPKWHVKAHESGMEGENLAALEKDYDEVLAWRRQQLWDVHESYSRQVKKWGVQAEAGSVLQSTPPEVRLRVLQTCLAGETPRRMLNVLRTLELVNHSWAVMVEYAQSHAPDLEGKMRNLAEYVAPILWNQRDGVLNEAKRLAGKRDDLLLIAKLWGLPAQNMDPAQLDAVGLCRAIDFVGDKPYTLNPEAVFVRAPPVESKQFANWESLLKSQGDRLHRVAISIFELDSERLISGLKNCSNLRELKLNLWQAKRAMLTPEQIRGQDYSFLSELTKLEALEVPAAALENIPRQVLAKLRSLSLKAYSDSPAWPKILNSMLELKELTVWQLGSVCQSHWLTHLPPGLQRLDVAYINALRDLCLPASLRSLKVDSMGSAAGLALPRDLAELNLFSGADHERLDLACAWLERAGERACSLTLGPVGDASLIRLINTLQAHGTALQRLRLPPTRWGTEAAGKLACYITGNARLSQLSLDILLCAGDGLRELNLIISALTASQHLRQVQLRFEVQDQSVVEKLDKRMRKFGRETPYLEWSCSGALAYANWPNKLAVTA